MKKLILLFLITLFSSCDKSEDIIGDCFVSPEPDRPCIEIYEPVCACNNVVYSNSCYAERAGNLSWKPSDKNSGEECNY